jgi:hypothetical protein
MHTVGRESTEEAADEAAAEDEDEEAEVEVEEDVTADAEAEAEAEAAEAECAAAAALIRSSSGCSTVAGVISGFNACSSSASGSGFGGGYIMAFASEVAKGGADMGRNMEVWFGRAARNARQSARHWQGFSAYTFAALRSARIHGGREIRSQ